MIRENRVIGDYALDSLRREKDDAREVREGLECGIKLAGFNDIKEGDVLEAYKIEEVKRTFAESAALAEKHEIREQASCKSRPPRALNILISYLNLFQISIFGFRILIVMSSRRVQKVAEAIREVVSMSILTELQDPRVRDVTVTGVEASGDLRYAKVMVSVMGDETRQNLTLRGLQSAAGFLQAKIADRIDLRYTPRLTFVLDQGVKHSISVAQILREVLPGEKPAADAETACRRGGGRPAKIAAAGRASRSRTVARTTPVPPDPEPAYLRTHIQP